jgi:oleandomycin transport system ATP-binding protein
VIAVLGSRGFSIAHIGTHLPSLDEVFLAITGEKTSGAAESARTAGSGSETEGVAA